MGYFVHREIVVQCFQRGHTLEALCDSGRKTDRCSREEYRWRSEGIRVIQTVLTAGRETETSFSRKGRKSWNEIKSVLKQEQARVRATAMEGYFGTQKEHYGLKKVMARIKSTAKLLIFFGIHNANAVLLSKRQKMAEAEVQKAAA